jgi:hypothetical protein
LKNTTPELHTEVTPGDFTPTQEQIDTFARRMAPVIQQFFADAEIQQEFAKWQKEHKLNKS